MAERKPKVTTREVVKPTLVKEYDFTVSAKDRQRILDGLELRVAELDGALEGNLGPNEGPIKKERDAVVNLFYSIRDGSR